MNRRSLLTQVAAVAAASLLRMPHSQGAARSKAELTVTDITDRLFVIAGGGGNVAVFNSSDGVLLVDGGSPERSADVLKLVKRRTGTSRIHTLINTHWHWDHTGSNPALGRAGTKIIAHENTRLWLSTEVDSKWEQRVYPRLPARARPNQTFYATLKLPFGGEAIELGHLPQAHTDGDIYVRFTNANVLVAGDVVSVGSYPIPDYCTNGWIGGLVNATQALQGLCNPATRVIPGTGAVQTPADLEAERAMLVAMKTKMSQLLAQGMSVKDMLAAAPTRDYDAKWGDPKIFVANVWEGLVPRARELGVSIV